MKKCRDKTHIGGRVFFPKKIYNEKPRGGKLPRS